MGTQQVGLDFFQNYSVFVLWTKLLSYYIDGSTVIRISSSNCAHWVFEYLNQASPDVNSG